VASQIPGGAIHDTAVTSQIPNCTNPPLLPIKIDGNLEFKIAQVLNLKLDKQRKDPLLYYVHLVGYEGTAEEFLWLAAVDL